MQYFTFAWVYRNNVESIYFISRTSRRSIKGCASICIRVHTAPSRRKDLRNPTIFVVIAGLLAFNICYAIYNITPAYVQSPETIWCICTFPNFVQVPAWMQKILVSLLASATSYPFMSANLGATKITVTNLPLQYPPWQSPTVQSPSSMHVTGNRCIKYRKLMLERKNFRWIRLEIFFQVDRELLTR